MKTVDPKLLQVFSDVVDQGSFTGAADLRESDASYVTRQIKKLESQLALKLLNRTTRAISLTEQGRQVYAYARQLNDLMKSVSNIADENSHEVSGTLKVTSSIYLGKKFLLPVVEKLCDQYPKANIEVHLSDDQVDIIKDRYDLALRVWKPKNIDLIAKKLLDVRFMLVAPVGFIQRYGYPKSVKELEPLPAIAYSRKGHTNKAINYVDSDGQHRSFQLNASFSINDDSDVEAYGVKGFRYFLATNYMAAEKLRSGDLVQLLPDTELPLEASVSVVYPNRGLPRLAELLVSELELTLKAYQ